MRVIHAGFHKTGTSTIEHFLLRNANVLRPHLEVIATPQLGEVVALAKRYSAAPKPARLSAFAAAFAQAMPPQDRPTLVSCVDLCGGMPGDPGVQDYRAAPALVGAMRAAGPARFAFGVRPGAAWLRSLWMQNLKVHRLTDDLEAFAARFAAVSDLDVQTAALEDASGGSVLRLPLEMGATHPLGLAGPLLELFGLPDISLLPQKPLKVGLRPDMAALLLKMNRSDLSDADLRRTKSDALALMKATQ